MTRSTISTGKPHQRDIAVWVRRRLADGTGRTFKTENLGDVAQHGVILADGVGLGKTWEALAASALLLVERSKIGKTGVRRKTLRQKSARVLVLCPPGLVSKWFREVSRPDGFSKHLASWSAKQHRRKFVEKTLSEPYEIRRQSDLNFLPPGKYRRDRFELESGIYICNWNVLLKDLGPGRSRLRALREQEWDIVIIDEAHHPEGRKALGALDDGKSDPPATILLTATPFQLEPREIHGLFEKSLERKGHAHKLLSRSPVREFVHAMTQFFDGALPPALKLKKRAEATLRQLVAKSVVSTSGRRFFVLSAGGIICEENPQSLLERTRSRDATPLIEATAEFQAWYLRNRLELCDSKQPTFVPNTLRQLLSTPLQAARSNPLKSIPPNSPRLDALCAWATEQTERDLLKTMRDGHPRKILVFTSFVREAAEEIRNALNTSVTKSWKKVRKNTEWQRMASRAEAGLNTVQEYVKANKKLNPKDSQSLLDALRKLTDVPIFCDLLGNWRFRKLVVSDIKQKLDILEKVSISDEEREFARRLRLEERKGIRKAILGVGRADLVRTYTGRDDRGERDASGDAFRSPLAPWALVASNVGSEGIDLHNYSAHLVHFDIEWNPGKMEQREGRCDRIGRALKDPVNIYFVLVRDTYDERMLHQLVARQRWHSVLLGAAGAKLSRDKGGNIDSRLPERNEVEKFKLDLRPKRQKA